MDNEIINKRYKVINDIGFGNQGSIYEVQDIKLKERRAIKEIHIKNKRHEDIVTMMNEIVVLSGVKHDNIITYYEHFTSAKFLYIVLEYCEGGDLEKYLDRKKNLSQNLIINWTRQLVSAIKYLHENDFIHRDIKPANIFIKNNHIKLGDFGISKKLYGTKHTSLWAGTSSYMCPELINNTEYDNKCDVWALGIVLFEMLTNTKPFLNQNEILFKETPELPSKHKKLSLLVRSLLKKDTCQRIDINEASITIENLYKAEQDRIKLADLLFKAIEANEKDTVIYLINSRVDTNYKNENGNTPLMIASKLGHEEITKILINNRANVNEKNNYGSTALIEAAFHGYSGLVELLLQNDANKNEKNEHGETALILASENGHLNVVQVLIDKNANINSKEINGYNALICASSQGHKEIVQLLLNKNANPHDKDKYGRTALMMANKNKHQAIAQMLLKYAKTF